MSVRLEEVIMRSPETGKRSAELAKAKNPEEKQCFFPLHPFI
jgi:hypothetical protein